MGFCEFCFSRDGERHLECCPTRSETHPPKLKALTTGMRLARGRFTVGTMLSQGGFGMTYLCRDNMTGRRIALKEFFPDKFAHRMISDTRDVRFSGMDSDSLDSLQAQFYREYDIMRKAACAGIPAVYAFFTENRTAYYAMDFIEGVTFKKFLMKQESPLPWWYLRKQFFYPLLDIVSYIHRKGILHRDISLVNVMITPKEDIYLLDFGAARDFHEKDTVEKLRFANKLYAPIEQTNPEKGYKQGPWTDIFAMGTVFYAAITNHYPPMALERPQKAVESAQIYVPDLPNQIDDALMQSLYYYPKYRFLRTEDFWAALAACPEPQLGTRGTLKLKQLMKRITSQLKEWT